MTDALDLVIDAALERALLADDARRHFALAGALERGRSATRTDGAEPGTRSRSDSDNDDSTRSGSASGVLEAALLSTVAVEALESARADGIDPGAWSPGSRGAGPRTELIAAGAAAACRRFDVEPAAVAARSGLPSERLTRYLTGGDPTPGSE